MALLVASIGVVALAQSATRLLLERTDADIEIVNEGLASDGARTILRLAGCEADPDVRTNLFYAPGGGVTARIDRGEGEPAVVFAPLMIVLQPGGADAAEAKDEETLEALDVVAASFGRPPCLTSVDAADAPSISLQQGRTTAEGTRFFLDQGVDVASLEGPIVLQREAEGDGPVIDATARDLQFDLDSGRSTLSGNVRVVAGTRESEADSLELDEEAGIAILVGQPAVSRDGTDVVRGDRLYYDLETNDVVVEGSVKGSFELGDEP